MKAKQIRICAWTTLAAAMIVLSGCPNPVTVLVQEDVLVEKAGGRPAVVGQVPAAGAVGVLSSTTIEVEFNMPLAADATDHLRVTSGGPTPQTVDGTLNYDVETNKLIFVPAAPLAVETRYTVTLSEELRNAGGAPLGSATSWSFDTTLVNPDQFRFDIDTSLLDIDLSTYRIYVSVQTESSVSDSFLGGDFYGGAYGANPSFVIDASEVGAAAGEGIFVTLIAFQSEFIPVDPAENEGFPNGLVDPAANILVWLAYKGSMGNVYPQSSNLTGASIYDNASTVTYGSGGFPLGIGGMTTETRAQFDNTLFEDAFFERGVVHTLTPEDAFLTLDYADIQSIASPVTPDVERRVGVGQRYGFSALTFESGSAGAYAFRHGSDSVNNRDTFSHYMLFERSGQAYVPVLIGGEPAVTTQATPTFGPYDEGSQFGYRTWQVDSGPDVQNVTLAASSEYLIVADSWLHLPVTGTGQISAGAFDLLIDSTPP